VLPTWSPTSPAGSEAGIGRADDSIDAGMKAIEDGWKAAKAKLSL